MWRCTCICVYMHMETREKPWVLFLRPLSTALETGPLTKWSLLAASEPCWSTRIPSSSALELWVWTTVLSFLCVLGIKLGSLPLHGKHWPTGLSPQSQPLSILRMIHTSWFLCPHSTLRRVLERRPRKRNRGHRQKAWVRSWALPFSTSMTLTSAPYSVDPSLVEYNTSFVGNTH